MTCSWTREARNTLPSTSSTMTKRQQRRALYCYLSTDWIIGDFAGRPSEKTMEHQVFTSLVDTFLKVSCAKHQDKHFSKYTTTIDSILWSLQTKKGADKQLTFFQDANLIENGTTNKCPCQVGGFKGHKAALKRTANKVEMKTGEGHLKSRLLVCFASLA